MNKKQIKRREGMLTDAFAHLHPLLQRLYTARHIRSTEELERQLAHLHPYHSLLNIDQAVACLAEALTQNQKILIVGDFDADGATSTTIAMRALRSFGSTQVAYLVPNRFAYGYGLSVELVEFAYQQFKPHLIVTVDNGIANHLGVEKAKSLGMKVLVTDHHLAAETLPPADVIVNPNQPNDFFPSKCLAGVGVIFYVMLALRRHLVAVNWFAEKNLAEPNMSHLLDIVALGTVADLVPLDHNNRILVHHGLQLIRAGRCVPGIVALLELSGRDFREAVASDLGFAVAARLNAAGRLDDMSLGIECLLTDDPSKARAIARTLDQFNLERRSIEKNMQSQALVVLDQLHIQFAGKLPFGLCLFDESWHQGVIGILASRLKDRFHRPVIIFALGMGDELKGSARSINGLHIRDTLACINAKYPELIIKFGGHAMAAGLSIKRQNFKKFNEVFTEIVTQQLDASYLEHALLSDGELKAEEFTLEVATMLRDAGPWGQAFPEPLFDDTFKILEQRIVGDKHLKLRLAKENKILEAVAFFVDMAIWPNHRCETVRTAYRLDINEYKGRRNIQLIVEYLEPVTESDVL